MCVLPSSSQAHRDRRRDPRKVKLVARGERLVAALARRICGRPSHKFSFTVIAINLPAMQLPTQPFNLSFMEPNLAQERWHYMMLHDSDVEWADTIDRFLEAPLRAGHGILIVATAHHLRLVRQRVGSLDIASAEERQQLVMLDAQRVLDLFMVNGMPDRDKFSTIVTEVLMNIAREYPTLHIYGEMVALLMEEGNHAATQMLEELWNNLGRVRPFELLCGYPRTVFAADAGQLERICNCHTHLFP